MYSWSLVLTGALEHSPVHPTAQVRRRAGKLPGGGGRCYVLLFSDSSPCARPSLGPLLVLAIGLDAANEAMPLAAWAGSKVENVLNAGSYAITERQRPKALDV